MLIKFFARGKGKGSGPVEYITRIDDRATGKLREPAPEVIRGNPEFTQQLIDSLDFKYKYNSGVLSFAPEDAPTTEQQQKLIDSFEKYAFAGLSPDQYDILWVRHTHTGSNRVELHFVTPRVELDSGKSLNIAPPGWEQYFKPWRDYWNITNSWARPDDRTRARQFHPGNVALIEANNLRAGLSSLNDPRTQLTEYITERIEAGQIKNRDDIISEFKSLGLEIPRAGENYITVLDPETNKRYRLKGGIYEKTWTVERSHTKENVRRKSTLTKGGGGEFSIAQNRTRERASDDPSQIQKRIRALVNKRAEYHNERYSAFQPNVQTIFGQPDNVVNSSSRESLSGYLSRQLGDNFIFVESDSIETGGIGDARSRNNLSTKDVGAVREEDQRNNDNQHQQRDIHYPTPIQRIERRLAVSGKTLFENGIAENERTRTEIDERLFSIGTTIQAGHDQVVSSIQAGYEDIKGAERTSGSASKWIEQTGRNLSQTNSDIERANRELNDRLRQNELLLERIRLVAAKKRAIELERFKTDINLVEYARSIGYEYVNTESSRNSAVLRHSNGDKIVVATDRNGHGIYFSVRDENDNGTIIEFVQQRYRVSKGEVRKELRAWLDSPKVQPKEQTNIPKLLPIEPERYQVLKTFSQFQTAQRHPYLEKRGIAASTLSDERFLGTVKIDSKNNVIFPHYDADGLTGFEIKNDSFTSFSRDGTKGLWESNKKEGDRRLVITKSAIDALSYHQLFPDESTRYISTGDTLGNYRHELISLAMVEMKRTGGEIIIATTNDSAGNKLAESLAKQASDRSSLYRHKPEQGQSWNEVLQQYIQRELNQRKMRQANKQKERGLEL
jgi:Toprim-like/Relaxase/Mobilisation nuclease domain